MGRPGASIVRRSFLAFSRCAPRARRPSIFFSAHDESVENRSFEQIFVFLTLFCISY